jgi:hypothetical protein
VFLPIGLVRIAVAVIIDARTPGSSGPVALSRRAATEYESDEFLELESPHDIADLRL